MTQEECVTKVNIYGLVSLVTYIHTDAAGTWSHLGIRRGLVDGVYNLHVLVGHLRIGRHVQYAHNLLSSTAGYILCAIDIRLAIVSLASRINTPVLIEVRVPVGILNLVAHDG